MENYQDSIDKYFDGKMNTSEKGAFENRLADEPSLKEAFELEAAARKLVQVASRERLKARFNKMDAEKEAKIIRPLFSRRNLLLVASIAVLLFAGYWITSKFSGNNNAQLFAQYYETYRPPTNQRGDQTTESDNWDKGIEFYKKRDFNTAITAFEKALSDKQAPDYLIHFYLGQSYLAKQSPDSQKAIEAFEQVLSEENFYQQQAKWYIALAYLQSGQVNESIILLQELTDLNDFKSEEAAAILMEISEK